MTRLLATGLLLICLGLPATGQAAVWVDAMNRPVELTAPPQRIVSLVPSVTEILFALGAGDQLVGATRFCTYPPAARDLPRVGDYSEPSLEAIAVLAPDLVVLAADAASPALLARIEALDIAAYVVYPKGITGTVATIRQLGEVVGQAAAAERLASELQLKIDTVRQTSQSQHKPRVLFCVMTEPLVVAGPGTLIDDLLQAAGASNVVPTGPVRYPTWGAEALLAADPDILILSVHPGQQGPDELMAIWPELRASRDRQVVTVEADWVSRPGPRLALGAQALAEIFQHWATAQGKASP